ncbi:MAG: hypothetical protein EPN84_03005 [Legionella sp.]|nr:MAG: hypothetical protein EPN84_03005 [Legionella sp.]
MNDKLQELLKSLVPFIAVGIAIALVIGLLVMFSYVFVWGLLIGGILWAAALVKQYLFPSETIKKEEGRIIEHDDQK